MSHNSSGPETSTVVVEDGAREIDQLDGSIASENNAATTQVKFAHAITRAEFAAHHGNWMNLSAMKRHRPHLVRAPGRKSSWRIVAPNRRDYFDPHPFNWRAHLPVHPAAEVFPVLSERELKELAGDIKLNGLKAKIVTWIPKADAKPQLIDGRNRLDALALIGQLAVDEQGSLCIKKQDGGLELIEQQHIVGGDPEKHAYSLNLHRRHLTPEQKRELIARLLKAKPEASDRQIGKQTGVDHKTVAAARQAKEATGEIPQLKKTIGVDGKARKRPAQRKKTAKPKRSTSQDQRELQAKQAHINELEAAREHDQDQDLAERLRVTEIKIVGLEGEIADLKDENAALKTENAALREKLEAAQQVAARGLAIDAGGGSS